MTTQSVGTEVGMCSVIGRTRELAKGLRLLRDPENCRNLVFLGAPRVGKSSLLQEISRCVYTRLMDEERERLVCVELDCTEERIRLEGNPVSWQMLVSLIAESLREHNPHLHQTLSEKFAEAVDRESVGEWTEFLSSLSKQSQPLYVFFILDDFDKACSAPRDEEALDAQDLISFASLTPNVKLIATARYRLSALPAESIWLRLLSESDARELAKCLLKARGKPNKSLLDGVLELAGYHPFQIRTLCDRLGEEEINEGKISAQTKKRWKHSSVITQYLEEVRDYLETQVKDKMGLIGIWHVLGRISNEESCRGYQAEVNHLKDWAVIVEDDEGQLEIPSELLKRAVNEWLFERGQQKRTKKFDAQRFFWLTYVAALVALVYLGFIKLFAIDIEFKVLGREFDAQNIALLFPIVPLLYLLVTRRFIGKIRFWLNSTIVRRVRKNAF